MLEYWMANNDSVGNGSELEIKEVLEDPSSATLFSGYPPWLLYFAAGCCILFMLIGIPGNLITVAALFRTKKLRNATAVFIMNLSVSDLMFCCFNLPLATSTFWQSSWKHGPLLCRLFPLLRYGLVAVSLFTVLAITINRYVMIGHPRLYPKLYRPKYLVLMVLATWISGFGALVATWFEQWGRFGLDPVIGSCSILPDVNGRSPKEFLFILAFLAPCIAIIVCYARIFYIVRKTALKSRRREKVTNDLVKASIDMKYTKNFEDSAIGSSCGATLTTTENGGSPTKFRAKSHLNLATSSSSSSNITNNHRYNDSVARDDNEAIGSISRDLSSNDSSKSDERAEECYSSENPRSSDVVENIADNFDSDRNESSSSAKINDTTMENTNDSSTILESIGNLKKKIIIADSDDARSNFERSIEFIPYIDTCGEQQAHRETEIDSVLGNSENTVSQSIPNLRFFEADSSGSKSDLEERMRIEDNDRRDCCLKVPRRFTRCSEKTSTRGTAPRIVRTDSKKSNESSRFQETLDTKSLGTSEERDGVAITERFLIDIRQNSHGFLSPRTIRQTRHNSDLSDDYASSRSDSPSERHASTGKNSAFRRESRFRSVRNRGFESGKMTAKDKKLLKMILVIFSSFLVCYLPITITKTFKDVIDWRGLNIAGYILIYLTTCINPIIYVVMSSEYRSAYKNVLLCRSDSNASNCRQTVANVPAGDQERIKSRNNGHEKKESIY